VKRSTSHLSSSTTLFTRRPRTSRHRPTVLTLASLGACKPSPRRRYSAMSLQADCSTSKWCVRGLFRSLLNDGQVSSSPCDLTSSHCSPSEHHSPNPGCRTGSRAVSSWQIGDVEVAALRFACDKSVTGCATGVWKADLWTWAKTLPEGLQVSRGQEY
jgi:hypothetical protein